MSAVLRPVARVSQRLSTSRSASAVGAVRAFHSPFTVLDNSPLTSPPSSSSNANIPNTSHYEKHYDTDHGSFASLNGYRTYVVSQPDTGSKYYQVPAGAYPTSAPYVQFTATEAPQYSMNDISSTAAELLAHPITRSAPQNPSGVGASSAIREGVAPGAMGKMGGSHGGLGMMDKAGTTPGKLADRNPQPDGPAAAKFSKAGVGSAWKMRI
ncbi:hypothetical protein CC1G_07105 [Coprinopsis cinerea okayama7|uniref:Uncharacterized protein n=1 Tax=Coprinopsis cinerea (strain Okayama-7 / 130 / ATCC MYA-4618 / FGSC 9003) TaxID=240176 RepID=A8NUH3_COPC7|nr:hypothetical protein CC1G_07105 [Coprinopsis cinerea okayama7\|eukprot:XP_001836458.2 hypothetical protein CC1G_07105 [Coprinopsis cinerea okayama7\